MTTAWLTARPTPSAPPRGRHALVTADDRDDRAEHRALQHATPRGRWCDAFVKNVAQNGPSGAPLTSVASDAAEDAEQQRVDVEQPGDEHQRQEARDDEVLDRVDAEDLQRVELLADLAGAEVGGDRRARDAGEHDRRHERRELADRGEDEEAAEAVQRAEQDEEVGGLQARRAVAEGDRRDEQREPAEPQREQELTDELAAVRVRRTKGRHDRLARQDHHVPDFFEQVLRRKKCSIGDATYHLLSPQTRRVNWSRRRDNLCHDAARAANRQPHRNASFTQPSRAALPW